MSSSAVEVMRMLDAWPEVQQSLVTQLATINTQLALPVAASCRDEEYHDMSLGCASFFFPSPSSGHPPLPHQARPATSIPLLGSPCTCDEETKKLQLRLALRLDVFRVLQLSPALGELLMLQPYTGFQRAMEDGVVCWLTHAATTARRDGYAKERVNLIARAARGWPPCLVARLVQQRVAVQMRLLLLRVPHFYACVTSSMSPPPPPPPRQHSLPPLAEASTQTLRREASPRASLSAVVACLSDIVGEQEEGAARSLGAADFAEELRELWAARSAAAAGPAIGCPSDAFVESDPLVTLVGVVQEVHYVGRTSVLAMPRLGFVVYPQSTSCLPSHSSLDPALRERKELDIHLLPPDVQQRVAVVGEVLRVEGRLAVAPASPTPAATSNMRGRAMTEYMEVHRVCTLLQPCELGATAQAEPQQPFGAPVTPFEEATTNTAPCTAAIGADGMGSAADEQAAALQSLRSWEGARLALGIRQTVADLPSISLLDGEAAVVCTDVFALSLDTVVAELLTLISAQLRPGLGGGVTLFVLDENGTSHVKEALTRLATVAPAAFMEVDPVYASRSHGAHYLPTYKLLRAPRAAPVPHRRAPAFDGTIAAASQKSHYDTTAEQAQGTATEMLCGGLLSQAGSRAIVLRHVELLPTDALQTLQDALRAEEAKSHGCDSAAATAVVTVGALTGLPPHELGTVAAVGCRCGGGDARGGQLVVRRDGGQRVRYRVTRAALCALSDAAALLQRPALFEFAQRQDLVLRPSFDAARRTMALYGTTTLPSFRMLLQLRSAVWLRRLASVFASACKDQLCPVVDTPQLTGGCGELLRTYFLAARAVCKDAVDASMMTTLVKLTCCHAVWRERVTRSALAPTPPSADVATTRLIDALVAIGLCDATLHFLTGRTLLGTCIFAVLQRELGSEEGHADLISRSTTVRAMRTTLLCHDDNAAKLHALARNVEFMTRPSSSRRGGGDAAGAATQSACQQVAAFSIIDMTHDLVNRLQRYMSPSRGQ